jgi:predicted phosphodiesterase
MTRPLAVIADVHGNRWALAAVLADIARRGIADVVNLGDCVYGPLDPAGTADILAGLDIPTVRGNEDRIVTEPDRGGTPSATLAFVRGALTPAHLRWLESLPPTRVIGDTLLCHGTPERDDRYLLHEIRGGRLVLREPERISRLLGGVESVVVLCGHDHTPGATRLRGGTLVVNPGSVGLQAYTDDVPGAHAVENETPDACYCILGSDRRVEHVRVPYDVEPAVRAARENGRPDWARWLETGSAGEAKTEGVER